MNPFKKISFSQHASTQLYEAKRMGLEHAAAAEHHAALTLMYEARVARLQQAIDADRAATTPKRPAA
jgi:hypothetical protein